MGSITFNPWSTCIRNASAALAFAWEGFSLLFACRNRDLAAAVVFYGRSPSSIDLVKNIQCPILGNYARADMAITQSDISLLKQTLTKYGEVFGVKVYRERLTPSSTIREKATDLKLLRMLGKEP